MDAVEWAVKRQLLDGLLDDVTSAVDGAASGLLGGANDEPTTTADSDDGGGLIPTLNISSDSETETTDTSTSTSSSSSSTLETTSTEETTTPPLSTSATDTTTSASPTSTVESETTPLQPSSTAETQPTASESTTETPPATSTVVTDDGSGNTITTVVTETGSASSPSGSADESNTSPSGATAFMENKVLMGVVFGLVGLVALVLIIFIITWFVRRTKRQRDTEVAVDWSPQGHINYEDDDKRGLTQSIKRNSTSSNGHGAGIGAAGGYYGDAHPVPTYQQQQPYYGATGAAAPFATYAAPSQIMNAMRTYETPAQDPGMTGSGGATVTRKYSNVSRVPAPNTTPSMRGV